MNYEGDRMTNANPSLEQNDRPTEANAKLSAAEAIALLERDQLTPEQLQAIALALHEEWG